MAERATLLALRDQLLALDPQDLEELSQTWNNDQRKVAAEALTLTSLEPHQQPPTMWWRTWLLLAGRGAGKTYAAAHWMDQHMSGPPCDPRIPGGHRAVIIAPTLTDAFESCVAGPSGLRSINDGLRALTHRGGSVVRWPNGSEARLFGAFTPEDVERLRAGGNRCAAWCEELAAWVKLEEVWDQLLFGLRLGDDPKIIASTTPKPRMLLKKLIVDATVAVTRASTNDNPHLHSTVRANLFDRYAGTRLGRQELLGELLEDVEGALFSAERLDENRRDHATELARVVVGVDPPGTSLTECGIIVAGITPETKPHYYVLADRSMRGSPEAWAHAVVKAYHSFSADRIVFEQTQGWDMGPALLQQVDRNVAIRAVHARRGKYTRAEPVAALDEQGRLHIVGKMEQLEEQCCEWVPGDAESPDRLDAMVWAISDLMAHNPHQNKFVSPGGTVKTSYWRGPAR